MRGAPKRLRDDADDFAHSDLESNPKDHRAFPASPPEVTVTTRRGWEVQPPPRAGAHAQPLPDLRAAAASATASLGSLSVRAGAEKSESSE